jgi:hypothetical protein
VLWPALQMTSIPIILIVASWIYYRSYDGTSLGFEIVAALSELNTCGPPPILKGPETLRSKLSCQKDTSPSLYHALCNLQNVSRW